MIVRIDTFNEIINKASDESYVEYEDTNVKVVSKETDQGRAKF